MMYSGSLFLIARLRQKFARNESFMPGHTESGTRIVAFQPAGVRSTDILAWESQALSVRPDAPLRKMRVSEYQPDDVRVRW